MYTDALSNIWCGVLQRDRVAHDDNFFALGGDSIKAIVVSRRILAELGHDVQFIDVLRYSTINAMAAALRARTKAEVLDTIMSAPASPSYPLSAVQREFYLLEQMTRREEASVACTVMHFDAGLSRLRSARAFRRILERHEVLRTTFDLEVSSPMQRVRGVDDLLSGFEYSDLSLYERVNERLQEIYEDCLIRPFDLRIGPIVRIHVCKVATARSVGFLSIHHIAADGFSAAILEKEFRAFCETDDESFSNKPLAFHYKDYAHWLDKWLNSPAGRSARDHWRAAFVGYRKQEFPTQPVVRRVPSFAAAREDFLFEPAVYAMLRHISVAAETTLFVVLQSCIKVFLYCETGSEDIVTGSPITTRDATELSDQVGPYLNTLPIRTRISGGDSFHEVVRKVKEATLAAYAHKLVPLEMIAAEVGHETKLFDVGFTLQNQNLAQREGGLWKLRPDPIRPAEHSESLTIKMWFVAFERSDHLEINLYYQKAALDRKTVRAMKDRLLRMIAAVADAPDAQFRQLFPQVPRIPVDAIELNLEDG